MVGEIWITVREFSNKVGLTPRHIRTLRRRRPPGFPTKYDLGNGTKPCPRFKLSEVEAWIETRALW